MYTTHTSNITLIHRLSYCTVWFWIWTPIMAVSRSGQVPPVFVCEFQHKKASTRLTMQVEAVSVTLRVNELSLLLQLFCSRQQFKAISSKRYIFYNKIFVFIAFHIPFHPLKACLDRESCSLWDQVVRRGLTLAQKEG